MTISPHEFKKAGEALDPGRRTRIEHSCGDGRTLIVSRDQKGISAYCHRCHKKGYIHTERSLAERIAALVVGRCPIDGGRAILLLVANQLQPQLLGASR